MRNHPTAAASGKLVGNVPIAAMMLVVATGMLALAAMVEATPKSPIDSAKTMIIAAKMAGRTMGATVRVVLARPAPWMRAASSKRRPSPTMAGAMAK